LVIVGGAEDHSGECRILRTFLKLAGGAKARILIMTVASGEPEAVGIAYVTVFRRLGAKAAQALDVRDRVGANAPEIVAAIEKATGVFFTGGDQVRITNVLGGSEVDRALHQRHADGMVIGGTSAGAAMTSATMIIGGQRGATPVVGKVIIGPGMEFAHGVIIDQHFGQRGRTGRLLTALAQYPHQLGIGIDEDTALIVHGEEFEVIGHGAVTVLDAGAATYNDVLERQENQHVALCNVRLHVLTEGSRFNLKDRTPVMTDKQRKDSHEARNHTGPAGSKHIHR
jgi:cyanophycinase